MLSNTEEKKEFEEKENESLMLKQLSSFTNVSHIARGNPQTYE